MFFSEASRFSHGSSKRTLNPVQEPPNSKSRHRAGTQAVNKALVPVQDMIMSRMQVMEDHEGLWRYKSLQLPLTNLRIHKFEASRCPTCSMYVQVYSLAVFRLQEFVNFPAPVPVAEFVPGYTMMGQSFWR